MEDKYSEFLSILNKMNNSNRYEVLENLSYYNDSVLELLDQIINDEKNGINIVKNYQFNSLIELVYKLIKLKKYNKEDINGLLNKILESKTLSNSINNLISIDMYKVFCSYYVSKENFNLLLSKECTLDYSSDNNLLNDEMIGIIVELLVEEERNNNITKDMSVYSDQVKELNGLLNELDTELKKQKSGKKDTLNKLRKCKVQLSKKIMSIILSASLSVSIGAGTGYLIDKCIQQEDTYYLEESYNDGYDYNNDLRDMIGTLLGVLLSVITLFMPKVGTIDLISDVKRIKDDVLSYKLEMRNIKSGIEKLKEKIIVSMNVNRENLNEINKLLDDILLMADYAFLTENQIEIVETGRKIKNDGESLERKLSKTLVN